MFTKWDEAATFRTEGGATRRTLAVGEKAMLIEWTMPAGAQVPLHLHPHEQSGYLVSGAIEMTIGGETRRLSPGDGYLAPGGVEHGAVALEPSRVVDIFAPVREDYL